jgi:hypothetical protein
VVDTSLLAAALSQLQAANPQENVPEFSRVEVKNKAPDGRDPDEIIVICLDISFSMSIPLRPEFNTRATSSSRPSSELTRVPSFIRCLTCRFKS